MGGRPVRPVVTKYLTDHVGEVVHLQDLTADLGLSSIQVHAAMRALVKDGVVEESIKSAAWLYRPNAAKTEVKVEIESSKRLFEEIGETKKGKIVLQDEDGKIYLATEVE